MGGGFLCWVQNEESLQSYHIQLVIEMMAAFIYSRKGIFSITIRIEREWRGSGGRGRERKRWKTCSS